MNKKEIVKDYLYIIAGTLLFAVGLNQFLTPIKLSTGGVTALGTIFFHLFKVPLSVTNLVFNAILFIFGYRYLGKSSVIKCAAGILLLSMWLQVVSYLPVYSDDILMATLAGAILIGIGIGLVIKREGSTGGSDFAALILNRFIPHISVPSFILFIDCSIIILSGIVFKSVTVTLYSIVALYVSTKVSDIILEMGDYAKSIQIVTLKSSEIAKSIMERFDRGVTGIYSKGMFLENDKITLLCVVSPKQLPAVINLVRKIDKDAFIIVSDVREVMGEGFKLDTVYDKMQTL